MKYVTVGILALQKNVIFEQNVETVIIYGKNYESTKHNFEGICDQVQHEVVQGRYLFFSEVLNATGSRKGGIVQIDAIALMNTEGA